jgi:hypothetical protein
LKLRGIDSFNHVDLRLAGLSSFAIPNKKVIFSQKAFC